MPEIVTDGLELIIQIVEVCGAGLLILGFVVTTWKWVQRTRLEGYRTAVGYYRQALGRSVLIGLEVLDTGGQKLGTVRSVQNYGATDLLEIFAPGQKTTVLLPFTNEAVPTVDLASGRIIADPPDGLFSDE